MKVVDIPLVRDESMSITDWLANLSISDLSVNSFPFHPDTTEEPLPISSKERRHVTQREPGELVTKRSS